MSYANIYYDPKKFGLRTIAEVEFSSGAYEFDTTVLWQDVETGAFYYADDSGCSCPSPFDDEDRSTIIPVGRMQDLLDHLEERKSKCCRYADSVGDEYGPCPEIDAACISMVNAFREARS